MCDCLRVWMIVVERSPLSLVVLSSPVYIVYLENKKIMKMINKSIKPACRQVLCACDPASIAYGTGKYKDSYNGITAGI